jgi:hypothetical protein
MLCNIVSWCLVINEIFLSIPYEKICYYLIKMELCSPISNGEKVYSQIFANNTLVTVFVPIWAEIMNKL